MPDQGLLIVSVIVNLSTRSRVKKKNERYGGSSRWKCVSLLTAISGERLFEIPAVPLRPASSRKMNKITPCKYLCLRTRVTLSRFETMQSRRVGYALLFNIAPRASPLSGKLDEISFYLRPSEN